MRLLIMLFFVWFIPVSIFGTETQLSSRLQKLKTIWKWRALDQYDSQVEKIRYYISEQT